MIALLDRLRDRQQQRTGSALDRLADAARDAAAGKTIDVAAVDAALHELHLPLEHFAELVTIAERRRTAGLALEKLGSATTKQRRLADAIATETHKYEEYRSAYLGRVAALETEKATVDEAIRRANAARETLLQVDNVIGAARQRYVEALDERQAAAEAVAILAREVRQQRDRLVEADRWIASIRKAHETELTPPVGMRRPESTALARELEPHEVTQERARRRLDELKPQVREAEERLDRAERSVVAIELEILKG